MHLPLKAHFAKMEDSKFPQPFREEGNEKLQRTDHTGIYSALIMQASAAH